jgi:hypothetical protein
MISLTGSIGPLVRTLSVERREVRIPVCWVRSPVGSPTEGREDACTVSPERGPLVPLRGMETSRWDREVLAGEAIAFLLGPEPPASAIQALIEAADRGARVYVLASPGFGEGRRDPGLSERRRARVLVRRIEGLPVSGVISGRGMGAGLWLGPSHDAAPRWWLRLSAEQGAALFRIFLYLFWHEAKEEAWTGHGPLRFRAAAARPFDVPLPGALAAVRLCRDEAPSQKDDPGEVHHRPGGEVPDMARRPAVLFTPARAAGQEALAPIARTGTRVVWEDLGLPCFRVGESAGSLELASGGPRIRVALEAAQARAFHRIAMSAEPRAAYRLLADAPLGVLEGEVWLPGQAAPSPRLPAFPIEAKSAEAGSLRAMPSTPAASLPEPPVLSLQADYRWSVLPPRAPVGATADALVTKWQELDTKVRGQADALVRRIEELERGEGALRRAFPALAGALVGFGRTREALRNEVSALRAERPSRSGPEGARGLLQRLAEMEKALAKIEAGLAEEEQKAREGKESEEQRRAWESARREAESALGRDRDDLSAAKDTQARIEAELGELAQGGVAGGRDSKDRDARRKRLRDELNRTCDRVKELTANVARHGKVLSTAFEYRPSRLLKPAAPGDRLPEGRAGGFIPSAPERPMDEVVPREALPEVGELLRWKEARYLVIARWEDLDEGEREAERLGARLVAPAEGP